MTDTYVAQVGGSHYQSAYQHWDWVIDTKMSYLEGCATKYVSRWRSSKGEGIKDLRKGLSFVDKLLKTCGQDRELPISTATLLDLTRRFAKANNLDNVEYHICLNIAGWQHPIVLQTARSSIMKLIEGVEAAPVPLTEENHHADRA